MDQSGSWLSAIFESVSKIKGKYGEGLAKTFLEQKGFEIIEENFRYSRSEVDLIGLKDDLLLFVEVKMRSSKGFGEAESCVTENQQNKIRQAADEYLHSINWQKDIRFDIITVDGDGEVEWFEDAFF